MILGTSVVGVTASQERPLPGSVKLFFQMIIAQNSVHHTSRSGWHACLLINKIPEIKHRFFFTQTTFSLSRKLGFTQIFQAISLNLKSSSLCSAEIVVRVNMEEVPVCSCRMTFPRNVETTLNTLSLNSGGWKFAQAQ